MSQQLDDLEAVRTLVTTLEKFEKKDQERIIRWAREKLGLEIQTIKTQPQQQTPIQTLSTTSQVTDLESFINSKNPSSDNQFAATVAYYYKFEAPENERRESIDSETLQNATRLSGRKRLSKPRQTLINANFNGLLDKAEEKGFYRINTVGENLVAITLPQNSSSAKPKRQHISSKKVSTKKSSKKK